MNDLLQEIEEAADLQAVVDLLHDRVEHYSWVGVYLVEGDDLVLGPWKGPQATEHVRIPVGQGVCGAAAASGETEVVDDVNADPREARVLERRLAVCDAPELERHHAPERERLGKGGSFPPRAR